jgi:hypothetical protein
MDMLTTQSALGKMNGKEPWLALEGLVIWVMHIV